MVGLFAFVQNRRRSYASNEKYHRRDSQYAAGHVDCFAGPAQANKIRIALAETPSDELAAFFVALDRAQKNGLDYDGQLFLMRNWQFKRSSVVKWTLDLELHTL